MKTLAFVAAILAAGCFKATPPQYSGPVRVASPKLVAVNPDVKTLADSDQPIFYVQNSYWLFHDGGWYQAPSLRATWVKVQRPPVPVLQIDQPYAYTHYRQDIDRVSSSEAAGNAVPTPALPANEAKQRDRQRSLMMFPSKSISGS